MGSFGGESLSAGRQRHRPIARNCMVPYSLALPHGCEKTKKNAEIQSIEMGRCDNYNNNPEQVLHGHLPVGPCQAPSNTQNKPQLTPP